MLSGNMGISLYWQVPVADILKVRLIFSIILMSGAFICAGAIDSLAAAALAKKAVMVNTAFYLTPFLFLGLLLMSLFAFRMHLFPVGGIISPEMQIPGMQTSIWAKLADFIYHLFLPTILLTVWLMIEFLPLVKTTSTGVIQEKKALLPAGISTLISASALFFGAMATETVFGWPGVHSAFVEASLNYDYPLIQGAVIEGLLLCLIVTVCFEILRATTASLE